MAEHMTVAWARPAAVEGDGFLMRPESVPKYVTDSLGHSALGEFKLLGEAEKQYEDIRERLENRVIGQSAAIDAVMEALEASAGRMPNKNMPIASFAFLGPTGVGKTELSRALADALGEGEGNLVKIDCSQFQHGHEVSTLLGSPPSYVGGEIQPRFAKSVIEKPATVVLFDEVEKGHADLHDIMLQIMEDGKIRLNNNSQVNFRNTIVIMTSNLGAHEMHKKVSGNALGFRADTGEGQPQQDEIEGVALARFAKGFKPEFVGRISKQVVFHPFDAEGMGQVLDSKVRQVSDLYSAEHGVCLSLSDIVRERLVSHGMEHSSYGARPLERKLHSTIFSELGRYVESDQVSDGTHVRVFHKDEIGGGAGENEFVYASKHEPSLVKPAPEPEVQSQSRELVPVADIPLDIDA